MKRHIMGVLLGVAILCQPITVQANSLSYAPPEEVDGIPLEIRENAEIIGQEFNICPELLESIAYQESRFTADIEAGSCKGLMQVNANCHKQRFIEAGWSQAEWQDPYKNMYVAADYLRDLFDEYEDVGIVLGVYHGESNAVSKAKKGQLSSYVKQILKRSEEYERAHGK